MNGHLEQECAMPHCSNKAGDIDDSLYLRYIDGVELEICGPCTAEVEEE